MRFRHCWVQPSWVCYLEFNGRIHSELALPSRRAIKCLGPTRIQHMTEFLNNVFWAPMSNHLMFLWLDSFTHTHLSSRTLPQSRQAMKTQSCHENPIMARPLSAKQEQSTLKTSLSVVAILLATWRRKCEELKLGFLLTHSWINLVDSVCHL